MNQNMSLGFPLQRRIEGFLDQHDLRSLYRGYEWRKDTWENGFPAMRQLEVDLRMAVKHRYLTKTHIISVARWGLLRNVKRISCPEVMSFSLYEGDDVTAFFRIPPSSALKPLRDSIRGIGPTYLSKILMFSRPQLYGAIDTRLVRVFGKGNADIEGLSWLSLDVKNLGYGWHIPEHQPLWPSEYDTWLEILHYAAHMCNGNRYECPHPDEYIDLGLREKGVWTVADVDTALFSYASKQLQAES